jgi:hypothetical protein
MAEVTLWNDVDGTHIEVENGTAKDVSHTDLVCPLCGTPPMWLIAHYDLREVRDWFMFQPLACQHELDTRVWELFITRTGDVEHWEFRRRDGAPPVPIPNSIAALRATVEQWMAEDEHIGE